MRTLQTVFIPTRGLQPTASELRKANDDLSLGEAPEKDGILSEVMKCAKVHW